MSKSNFTILNTLTIWLEWIFIHPFRVIGAWAKSLFITKPSIIFTPQVIEKHSKVILPSLTSISSTSPLPSNQVLVAPHSELPFDDTQLVCIDLSLMLENSLVKDALQGKIEHECKKKGVFVLNPFNPAMPGTPDFEIPTLMGSHCATLADECPLHHSNEIKTLIKAVLEKGHKIAILSLTEYPCTLITLLNRLNLSDKERKEIILVVGKLSAKTFNSSKHVHLEKALQSIKLNQGLTITPSHIMFIDNETDLKKGMAFFDKPLLENSVKSTEKVRSNQKLH